MALAIQVITSSFVCLIVVNRQGTIIDAAPLLQRFIGQPYNNLIRWITRNPRLRPTLRVHFLN